MHTSTQASRLGYLDAWRGMAIVCVLVGHFVTTKGMNFGRYGVELFFALSGSLIGQILFAQTSNQQPSSLRKFAIRRFSRIVPSMWIFCLTAVALASLNHNVEINSVASAFLGFANYSPPSLHSIDHLWSVSVELHGYVILALVAFISRKYSIPAHRIIVLILASSWGLLLTRTFFHTDEYYSTYWRTEFRTTAMLTAAALMSLGHEKLKSLPDWRIFFVAGSLLQLNPVPDLAKYTIGSVFIALACVHIRNFESLPKLFGNRTLIAFGGASYSIYLWQQIFFSEIPSLGKIFALTLAIVVGFSAHHILDKRIHSFTTILLERFFLPRTKTRSVVTR